MRTRVSELPRAACAVKTRARVRVASSSRTVRRVPVEDWEGHVTHRDVEVAEPGPVQRAPVRLLRRPDRLGRRERIAEQHDNHAAGSSKREVLAATLPKFSDMRAGDLALARASQCRSDRRCSSLTSPRPPPT